MTAGSQPETRRAGSAEDEVNQSQPGDRPRSDGQCDAGLRQQNAELRRANKIPQNAQRYILILDYLRARGYAVGNTRLAQVEGPITQRESDSRPYVSRSPITRSSCRGASLGCWRSDRPGSGLAQPVALSLLSRFGRMAVVAGRSFWWSRSSAGA